eukprot:1157186-Pelagomonas_calceolata.AAC.13
MSPQHCQASNLHPGPELPSLCSICKVYRVCRGTPWQREAAAEGCLHNCSSMGHAVRWHVVQQGPAMHPALT